MESTMTIRQAGAEGVVRALADGMKAAEYARRVSAVTAENDQLRNDIAAMEAENRRLNRENRYHRFSKDRAYAEALEAQVTGIGSRKERAYRDGVLILLGMVLGLAVAFGIVWCSGV